MSGNVKRMNLDKNNVQEEVDIRLIWLNRPSGETMTPLLLTFDSSDPVFSVALSPDGSLIAAGTAHGGVNVWEASSGKKVMELGYESDTGDNGRVLFNRNGTKLQADGRMYRKIWRVDRWEKIADEWHDKVESVEYEDDPQLPKTEWNKNGKTLYRGMFEITYDYYHIHVKNIDTGEKKNVHRFPSGDKYAFYSATVTGDGKYVIAGTAPSTIFIFERETGRQVHKFIAHSHRVSCLVMTKDDKWLVSGSPDKTVKIWDFQGLLEEAETVSASDSVQSHGKTVYALAVTGDGRYAYSGSIDHTCIKWDLESGQPVEHRKGENRDFGPFAVTSDDRYMVLTDYYGRVYDLEKKDIFSVSDKHKYFINAVAVTPDNRRVVTGSENGTMLLWDLYSGLTIYRLKDSHNHVLDVAVTKDGRFAVSAEYLNGIRVYNLINGKHTFDFDKSPDDICTLAISPDDRYVISGGKSGELKIWDLEGRFNGATVLEDRVILPKGRSLAGGGACPDGVKAVAVSPNGDYFVSAHRNQVLRVFHLDSGVELTRFRAKAELSAVAAAPGFRLVCADKAGNVYVLWLENMNEKSVAAKMVKKAIKLDHIALHHQREQDKEDLRLARYWWAKCLGQTEARTAQLMEMESRIVRKHFPSFIADSPLGDPGIQLMKKVLNEEENRVATEAKQEKDNKNRLLELKEYPVKTEDPGVLTAGINSDFEKRGRRDLELLVKLAQIPNSPISCRLDYWGQVFDIAYRQNVEPASCRHWLHEAVVLAKGQLIKRLRQLNLDTAMADEEVNTINEIYSIGSVLYEQYDLEAFRISQILYYYYIAHADEIPGKDKLDYQVFTINLGSCATSYGNSGGRHQEAVMFGTNVYQLFQEIDTDQWFSLKPGKPEKILNNIVYFLCDDIMESAMELKRFPEALEWSKRAELYVFSLSDLLKRSYFCIKRGNILLELHNADDAMIWYEKATLVDGLSPQQVKDAQRFIYIAKYKIDGTAGNFLRAAMEGVLTKYDIAEMETIFESISAGLKEPGDMLTLVQFLKKSTGDEAIKRLEENSALDGLPEVIIERRKRFATFWARNALNEGDFSKLEELEPQLKEIAAGDLPFLSLDSAFCLLRIRDSRDGNVTWNMVEPLVTRLLGLPNERIEDHLLDLGALLINMDKEQLLSSSNAIALIVEKIQYSDDNEPSPLVQMKLSSRKADIVDSFLTILTELSKVQPHKTQWWLAKASRIKMQYSHRGLQSQRESQLHCFAAQLPAEITKRVIHLAESLTLGSMQGKWSNAAMENEKEFWTLLFPLYRLPGNKLSTERIEYPELIHIEEANYIATEDHRGKVINIYYSRGEWGSLSLPYTVNGDLVNRYFTFISNPDDCSANHEALDDYLKAGDTLYRALFLWLYVMKSPQIIGLRSTGLCQSIPIETLPSHSGKTVEECRWIGSNTVFVQLTGENKDLEVIHQPVLLESVTVFANSEFPSPHLPLPGSKMEADAIEDVFKNNTAVNTTINLGADSNRRHFLNCSGAYAPNVLHIATHGIIDRDNPPCSCLFLSEKDAQGRNQLGAVGYHDILFMDLHRTDLVVLSACSTHDGETVTGEGAFGLAWAFKAAGAKAVVGTRWKVDDRVAGEFWKVFYQKLIEGQSIGIAFLNARLHIMNQKEWCHPYYWGVFQLIV